MFKCKGCAEKVSDAKMVGLVIGQIGREAATAKGITPQSTGDFLVGLISGYKINCPKCEKTNWEYKL